MSFSKLPIETVLEIIKALPYVKTQRKVPYNDLFFYRWSEHPDYKTSLRLCSVCKSFYMLLTPAFYASTHITLVTAQIEPFLHTMTASATFGKRLSNIRSLAFEEDEEDSETSRKYLSVAKRVFKRLVGDKRNAAPPRDLTNLTAHQDLAWMVLTACTSPAALNLVLGNLPDLVSPTIKRRLPLPTSWSRLTKLEIKFFVTPDTTAHSIFDFFADFPSVPSLRQLHVTIGSGASFLTSQTPATPLELSSVEELRFEDAGGPPIASKLLFQLIDACQPSRLTPISGHEGLRSATITSDKAFLRQLATHPQQTDTLVLQTREAWCLFVHAVVDSQCFDSIRRVYISISSISACSSSIRDLIGTRLLALPSALQEIHLGRYNPSNDLIDWQDGSVQARLDHDEHLMKDLRAEVGELGNGLSVTAVLETLCTKGSAHKAVYLDSTPSDLHHLSHVSIKHAHLLFSAESSAAPPLSCLIHKVAAELLSMLDRFIASPIDIFVPKTSLAALVLTHRHRFAEEAVPAELAEPSA